MQRQTNNAPRGSRPFSNQCCQLLLACITNLRLFLLSTTSHRTYTRHAMSSRTSAHPSLPAPTLHAGYSASQSKSHVLAGVQDAYWSDDEAVRGNLDGCNGLITKVSCPLPYRRTLSAHFALRRWTSPTSTSSLVSVDTRYCQVPVLKTGRLIHTIS